MRSGSLSELARHVILPADIAFTSWPSVRDTAKNMGILYDRWQDDIGRAILAKRQNGLFAAGVGGVTISICRQVGKTFTVGSMIIALCLLTPHFKVLWTAHRTRTAGETFRSMQGMVSKKKIAPYVKAVRRVNGEQEIEFLNGSRVMFGARESGFGRGFEGVDVEIFDEAQILTEKALDDMVPAVNTAKNPLIIFMGTPPKPSDPSEVFSSRRRRALSGLSRDDLYIEFSADEKADSEDREQWKKANPSFPHRTPESSILRLKTLLGDESFRREGMGIWDTDIPEAAFTKAQWDATGVKSPLPAVKTAFGVKFSPDGSRVALAGARATSDLPHVEAIDERSMVEGIGWLTDFLIARKSSASVVVIDGKAGVDSLALALREAGLSVKAMVIPTLANVVAAHSMFFNAVRDCGVTHLDFDGQQSLTDQVLGAKKRPIGKNGSFGWEPISLDGDVTLLDAVTLAHWGVLTTKRDPAKKAVMV